MKPMTTRAVVLQTTTLPPLFPYTGSKKRLLKTLKPYFDINFKTYVEPFCGGASVFFGTDLTGKNVVISDIDDSVIEAYKGIKNMKDYDYASLPEYEKDMNIVEMQEFIDNASSYGFEHYVATSMKRHYTFGCYGKGKLYEVNAKKSRTHFKRMNMETMAAYQNKLKTAKILNAEYKFVIDTHDAEDTLFYLDPPYEKKRNAKSYKYDDMDFEELATILKNIKGKFILSLNDSPRIQEVFKAFNIRCVETHAPLCNQKNGTRAEVIITNY